MIGIRRRIRGKDRLTRYQKAIIRACCVVYNDDPWRIAVGLAELQFCGTQDAFELGCEKGWIPDGVAGEVRELIFGDGLRLCRLRSDAEGKKEN